MFNERDVINILMEPYIQQNKIPQNSLKPSVVMLQTMKERRFFSTMKHKLLHKIAQCRIQKAFNSWVLRIYRWKWSHLPALCVLHKAV